MCVMSKSKSNIVIHGYWATAEDRVEKEGWPFPTPRDLDARDDTDVDGLLDEVEEICLRASLGTISDGHSPCRVCGEGNGSGEFEVVRSDGSKWFWPEGYSHYAKVHGVAYAPAFAADLRNGSLLSDAQAAAEAAQAARDARGGEEEEKKTVSGPRASFESPEDAEAHLAAALAEAESKLEKDKKGGGGCILS